MQYRQHQDYAIPIVGSRRVVCTHGGWAHVVAVLVAGISTRRKGLKRLTITKRKRCQNGLLSLTHIDGDSCKVVNVNSGMVSLLQ